MGICVHVHGVQKRAENGAVHSALGAENLSSGRALSAFHLWAIAPTPRRLFSLSGCFVFIAGRVSAKEGGKQSRRWGRVSAADHGSSSLSSAVVLSVWAKDRVCDQGSARPCQGRAALLVQHATLFPRIGGGQRRWSPTQLHCLTVFLMGRTPQNLEKKARKRHSHRRWSCSRAPLPGLVFIQAVRPRDPVKGLRLTAPLSGLLRKHSDAVILFSQSNLNTGISFWLLRSSWKTHSDSFSSWGAISVERGGREMQVATWCPPQLERGLLLDPLCLCLPLQKVVGIDMCYTCSPSAFAKTLRISSWLRWQYVT